MRKVDSKFIKLAQKEAHKGEFRSKHGVIIVRDKTILATGHNRNIGVDNTLSRYGVYWSIHAELDAIRKLPYKFDESCTLYSVRKNLRMAQPCEKCLTVIARTGISRIVFTVEPGKIMEMIL